VPELARLANIYMLPDNVIKIRIRCIHENLAGLPKRDLV
jgi:hypothetical protein